MMTQHEPEIWGHKFVVWIHYVGSLTVNNDGWVYVKALVQLSTQSNSNKPILSLFLYSQKHLRPSSTIPTKIWLKTWRYCFVLCTLLINNRNTKKSTFLDPTKRSFSPHPNLEMCTQQYIRHLQCGKQCDVPRGPIMQYDTMMALGPAAYCKE